MTLDEFCRNNRNINGGQNLPREYLAEVYNEIKVCHRAPQLLASLRHFLSPVAVHQCQAPIASAHHDVCVRAGRRDRAEGRRRDAGEGPRRTAGAP